MRTAAAQKLSAVSDPRARLLRKRRWALRLGVFFTIAAVFWVIVTAVLATWSTGVGIVDHRHHRRRCGGSRDTALPPGSAG